jgi:hypothetical protein
MTGLSFGVRRDIRLDTKGALEAGTDVERSWRAQRHSHPAGCRTALRPSVAILAGLLSCHKLTRARRRDAFGRADPRCDPGLIGDPDVGVMKAQPVRPDVLFCDLAVRGSTEATWVGHLSRVRRHDLLPNEIHVAHSARSVSQADPLAVDMDPHHHQSSCVEDRPTYSQCGASDRKQNGVAQS